jgi:NAD-dependent dihydropyrimidine dehydrogenase PreA subunit
MNPARRTDGAKWLPVIDRDYCTGCNACVEACDHHCLGLVWDFATLLDVDRCGSEGNCVEVCPENLIRMAWVPAAGSRATGRWRESG